MALTLDFTGKHALVFGGTTGRSKPQGGLQRRKRRPNDHSRQAQVSGCCGGTGSAA